MKVIAIILIIVCGFGNCAMGQQLGTTASVQQAPVASPPVPVPALDPLKLPPPLSARELYQTVEISPDYEPGKATYHTGTAFFVTEDDVPYLITAKHMFENVGVLDGGPFTLWVRVAGNWLPLDIAVHFSDDVNVDMAVATISGARPKGVKGFVFCGEDDKLSLGDEGLFLGYPFSMDDNPNDFNGSIPAPYTGRVVPFVKRATLSGLIHVDPGATIMLVLDGINNHGFSGGPLIFSSKSSRVCVAGVVVSYRTALAPVLDQNNQATPQSAEENSGIFYAVPTLYADEIIEKLRAHPDGR
jgi:hypothetical protein